MFNIEHGFDWFLARVILKYNESGMQNLQPSGLG